VVLEALRNILGYRCTGSEQLVFDTPSQCVQVLFDGVVQKSFVATPVALLVQLRIIRCGLRLEKNSGTVPELVRETTAMNWAVGGGIERRFHPEDGFRNQFR
jgi:hypothetical protein